MRYLHFLLVLATLTVCGLLKIEAGVSKIPPYHKYGITIIEIGGDHYLDFCVVHDHGRIER